MWHFVVGRSFKTRLYEIFGEKQFQSSENKNMSILCEAPNVKELWRKLEKNEREFEKKWKYMYDHNTITIISYATMESTLEA